MRILIYCLLFCAGAIASAQSSDEQSLNQAAKDLTIPPITNIKEIAKDLKLSAYKDRGHGHKVRIAILDDGFNGYEKELGKNLPKDTQYHDRKASAADTVTVTSYHGLFMAEIVAELIAASGADIDYELHLFKTFGYHKFEDAVDEVIHDRFDVVLYANVWEFGGNGDGRGYINTVVNRAVEAGIVWINAAGNFGRLTKIAPITGRGSWVSFANTLGENVDGVKIVCHAPAKSECRLQLVLIWNDFKDDVTMGTDKDLDLFLYDKDKKVVASSERHQKLYEDATDPLASKYPREIIETKIGPGVYTARAKIMSKNFSSQDRLRLMASGSEVEMVAPTVGETLLPPADNPGVIVIGAYDDILSSRSEKLKQPDIYFRSGVDLQGGTVIYSTSTASAMAAAVAALAIAEGTPATRAAVVAKLKSISKVPQRLPPVIAATEASTATDGPAKKVAQTQQTQTQQRRTRPIANREVPPARSQSQPRPTGPTLNASARWVMSQGCATLVNDGGRLVIAVGYDFVTYAALPQQSPAERVFASPVGLVVYGDGQVPADLPLDYYEVVSTDSVSCHHR